MGMTYDELSIFGRLRKVDKCGPYSMYTKLVHEWSSTASPEEASIVTLTDGDLIRSLSIADRR